MTGLLLDPYTGKAEQAAPPPLLSPRGVPFNMEGNFARGWRGGLLSSQPRTKELMDGLPDHIQEMLQKSAGKIGPYAGMRPPVADSSMYEVMRYSIAVDTSVTGVSAETIMVPAFAFSNSEMTINKYVRMTLWGSSTFAITTPGTAIMKMRWGGVAGTVLATSATLGTSIQTAAATTTAGFIVEYLIGFRAIGTTGNAWCQGRWEVPGALDPSATAANIVLALKATQIPATGAAVSPSTIDTTASQGPTPTVTPSVTTQTHATHLCILECLN